MKDNYTKEIDLIDLFIDWIGHWKSFLVFLLLGIILAGGYMYMGRSTSTPSTQREEKDAVENLAEGTKLSTLSKNQLAGISLDDMELYFLSEQDVQAVDEIVELNKQYVENLETYNSEKNGLDLKDRAETFNYIIDTKNLLETRKAALTDDQKIYYYAKLGVSTAVGTDGIDKKTVASNEAVVVNSSPSKKKAALLAILFIVLHFMVVSCRYIFSNTIKHSDNLYAMADVPEYIRMINWEKIDSSKGMNKLVNKMRFGKMRKTSLKDVVEINSLATVEKLKNKNYNSVAVVGVGLDDERNLLVRQIKNDNENVVAKSIDSITHNVNGADDIIGVDSAILAVRVGVSRYNEFMEELQALKDRDVDVIGIAVFEL